MKKLTKEESKDIIKKLKKKFKVEVEYLDYNRFALIESRKKPIENEIGVVYAKIRRYRLVDENEKFIELKCDYNLVTKYRGGVATVIIKDNPQIVEDSTGLKVSEIKKEGLIDVDGKELLPCIFDSVNVKLGGFVELIKDGVKKATNVRIIMSGDFNWDKAIDWE